MTTERIQFAKEKETMLITLNGRALQSQWPNPILRDPWAEEAMRHIDYDMSKTLKGVSSWRIWNKIGRFPHGVRNLAGSALRALSPAAWDRMLAPLSRVVPTTSFGEITGHRVHRLANVVSKTSTPKPSRRSQADRYSSPRVG